MENDDFIIQSTSCTATSTTDEILQDGTTVRTLETTAATIRFCFIDDTSTDSEDDLEKNEDVTNKHNYQEVNNKDDYYDQGVGDDVSEESSTACDLKISPASSSSFKECDLIVNEEINLPNVPRPRSIIDEDQIDVGITTQLVKNTVSPTSEYYSEGDTSNPEFAMDTNTSKNENIMGTIVNNLMRPELKKTDSVSSQSSQKSEQSSSSQTPPLKRFNPFNDGIKVNEDYFSYDKTSNDKIKPKLIIPTRLHSTSSGSSPDNDLHLSIDEDEFVFAHLGLDEDHFSQPEGHFGLSTCEELEMAIEHCKELIAKSESKPEKKQSLVQKLVQLRLKLQEAKEAPHERAADTKVVLGHHFQRQTSRAAKHYCEKCVNVIWGMLQIWYQCKDCGYSCHSKCLATMTRMCALSKIQESSTYILSIRPERGLAAQQYRCSECRAKISFKSGEEPRQCDYTGNYYCSLCHWNDTMVIPARVLHNWDFTPGKVCRASMQFLRLMQTRPSIDVQKTNCMLFSFVEELSEIKRLRQEILMMKQYFLTCQDALNSKLLLQLSHRQHFVDECNMYSMQDLIEMESEALVPELCKIHTAFATHIKTDCKLCHAKGHICEICNVHEAIFPFDNHVFVCQQCQAVLHRHCFRKKEGRCPRCQRKNVKPLKT